MRNDLSARAARRWWDSLGHSERIVAMSLIAGGAVAIINSSVWAVAVCYMTRQRTLAAIARATTRAAASGEASEALNAPEALDVIHSASAGRERRGSAE